MSCHANTVYFLIDSFERIEYSIDRNMIYVKLDIITITIVILVVIIITDCKADGHAGKEEERGKIFQINHSGMNTCY